jgi:RimJ/RimL family protein N-acetyltransferase
MINSKKFSIKYIPLSREHIEYRTRWLADPEINQFLGTATRKGRDKKFHRDWFDKYEEGEKIGERRFFMIKVDEKIVGQVGFSNINKDDKNAELYITIGEKNYWGKGIGKEALKYIHNYGFRELGLHKINLTVHTNNTRAIRIYKKFGYKELGVYHDNIFWNGKYEDETLMEIINQNGN